MKQRGNTLVAVVLVIGAIAAVGMFMATTYNGFVRLSQEVDRQYAVLEGSLQRRFDLIPNLVETVKGGMAQEQQVFGAIADARARMAGARTIDEKVEASDGLNSALGRLFVVMEAYPELRSLEAVRDLMAQLEGTENRINVERRNFNESVERYNVRIKSFPAVLFAASFGYNERPYLRTDPAVHDAPNVNFGG